MNVTVHGAAREVTEHATRADYPHRRGRDGRGRGILHHLAQGAPTRATRFSSSASGPSKFPVHLVHGEPEAQAALAETLRGDGYEVTMPERGATVAF